MRFAVFSGGEPIGSVDFDAREVAEGSASAELAPLPAYERVRPALERAIRALHESAERARDALRRGPPPPARPQGGAEPGAEPGAGMRVRVTDWPEVAAVAPEAARRAEGAMRSIEELHFALRDERGAPVPAAVFLYAPAPAAEAILGGGPLPPVVTAFFGAPPGGPSAPRPDT